MSPTPGPAALPKCVLRGAHANALAPLADSARAAATHICAHAPAAFITAPTSNPQQPKTYVLATLYKLEDSNFAEWGHDDEWGGRNNRKRVEAMDDLRT